MWVALEILKLPQIRLIEPIKVSHFWLDHWEPFPDSLQKTKQKKHQPAEPSEKKKQTLHWRKTKTVGSLIVSAPNVFITYRRCISLRFPRYIAPILRLASPPARQRIWPVISAIEYKLMGHKSPEHSQASTGARAQNGNLSCSKLIHTGQHVIRIKKKERKEGK